MSPYDFQKLKSPEDEPDEPEDDTNDRADEAYERSVEA